MRTYDEPPAPDDELAAGVFGAGEERSQQARMHEALGHAYRYLGSRDRTVAEVRRALERKGFGDLADECVRELADNGYLDDESFAQRFAEDRRKLDGWGAERIRQALTTRGIDPERAERISAERDRDEELAAAIEVLRRRCGAVQRDDRARSRALGLLVRRGYDLDLAYEAVRRSEVDASVRHDD